MPRKNILIKLKQFNIAYTIDDNENQLMMLKMSINTLVKFNQVDNIYIMYYNIDLDKLKNTLYFPDINIEYFNFDIFLVDNYFPELPNVVNKRLRYPSLSRWFISKVIPYDYYWYIDTDVLFNSNIREEFLEYQKDKLFYAFNRKEYKGNSIFFVHTDDINAGILFINAKMFNEMNLFEEVLEYYKNYNKEIIFVNQSVYNYLIKKYDNICKYQTTELINILPLFRFKKYFENQLKKVKVFHCNGNNKKMFFETYKIIMKKD